MDRKEQMRERNAEIVVAWIDGSTYAELGRKHIISACRVRQIVWKAARMRQWEIHDNIPSYVKKINPNLHESIDRAKFDLEIPKRMSGFFHRNHNHNG